MRKHTNYFHRHIKIFWQLWIFGGDVLSSEVLSLNPLLLQSLSFANDFHAKIQETFKDTCGNIKISFFSPLSFLALDFLWFCCCFHRAWSLMFQAKSKDFVDNLFYWSFSNSDSNWWSSSFSRMVTLGHTTHKARCMIQRCLLQFPLLIWLANNELQFILIFVENKF